MRAKTFLFLAIAFSGIYLKAQDTVRNLIISEARMDAGNFAYIELTNMGDSTLHLKNFELGVVHPWNSRIDQADLNKWFNIEPQTWFMLPDWTLNAGKSIVIANLYDYYPKMWRIDPDHWAPAINETEMWNLANIQIHQMEAPVQPTAADSVSKYYPVGQVWEGRDCWYLRYHLSNGDSIVTDQVGGVFTGIDGQQTSGAKDVAGVIAATLNSTLVRKYSVKQGNIDFNDGRGINAEESEWITIPNLSSGSFAPAGSVFWTVGNHVDAQLDNGTLVSNNVTVDFENRKIQVPWGLRRADSIMREFERKPGIAWHYDYFSNHFDSAYESVYTGDVLTVYACGNTEAIIPFTLEVRPPGPQVNIVIPKKLPNFYLWYRNAKAFCEVTDKVPGMDTIRANALFGIPFATRIDTLFKYLQKAPHASWRVIFVDGQTRPDLINGDILEVTAEDGYSLKQYYIKVAPYKPRHNALLASITWPDIPEPLRNMFDWKGDTIPGFMPEKFKYTITIPPGVVGIPALIAKSQDNNASLKVKRATRLDGLLADRTIIFTSIAEDNVTTQVYELELIKGKEIEYIQPWKAEPFISQYCFRQDYSNDFLEIVNPGTVPLDLSHYMLTFSGVNNPAEAISINSDASDAAWANRYVKYIPGMRWPDLTTWKVTLAMAIPDVSGIQPIVSPGDVFVIADKRSVGGTAADYLIPQIDLDFAHNPWGETLSMGQGMDQWWAVINKTILFKILNDSVYLGQKPATDPNDFKVIDMFGYNSPSSSTQWVIGGILSSQVTNWTRKPYIYKGNPLISTGVYPGGSFGTDENNSEWIMVDESRLQTAPYNYGWPQRRVQVADGIGSHFMDDVTFYKSTVSSLVYKLTPGYTEESIWGVVTGTSVAEFKNNILKADTAQRLNVHSHLDGSLINDTIKVFSNDTLLVISADSVNHTQYILTVTDRGLSNNDTLTSIFYTITIDDTSSSISGFPYGTLLKDVLAGIDKPAGSVLNVINGSNAYQPLKVLNYDTLYVNVQVSDNIYFEVIAENGVDKLVYQLKPTASSSDAFVTSDFYSVNQNEMLISLVQFGSTTVYGLLSGLIASPGATMVVVDKYGFERTQGYITYDDKLVVTAEDGTTTRIYYLYIKNCKCGPVPMAYVISGVYSVDQVNLTIDGGLDINNNMNVGDLIANLIPAPNATILVVDESGIENTGILQLGDKVKVISSDGLHWAFYTLNIIDGLKKLQNGSFSVYPNPSSGYITIEGISKTNKIQVSNILGQLILERKAMQDKAELNIEGQPAGIYFLRVIKDSRVVACFKLILK